MRVKDKYTMNVNIFQYKQVDHVKGIMIKIIILIMIMIILVIYFIFHKVTLPFSQLKCD